MNDDAKQVIAKQQQEKIIEEDNNEKIKKRTYGPIITIIICVLFFIALIGRITFEGYGITGNDLLTLGQVLKLLGSLHR